MTNENQEVCGIRSDLPLVVELIILFKAILIRLVACFNEVDIVATITLVKCSVSINLGNVFLVIVIVFITSSLSVKSSDSTPVLSSLDYASKIIFDFTIVAWELRLGYAENFRDMLNGNPLIFSQVKAKQCLSQDCIHSKQSNDEEDELFPGGVMLSS